MWRTLSAVLAMLALGTGAVPAASAQSPEEPLETRLVASKVVVVDGRESLVEAASARPGDVIEYTASYRNTGKDPIKGLKATLPIPTHTEFIPGTARPARASASADGLAFAPMPLKRTVFRDGKPAEEAVPYREYRAIRWSAAELGGGKTASFTARVRVLDDRGPTEPGGPGGGR